MKRRIALVIVILFSGILLTMLFVFRNHFQRHDSIIPNRELERVIIKEIGFSGDELKPEDCLGITELDLSATNWSTDLEGLQYFKDLEYLKVCGSYLYDISALSELTELKELDLSTNRLSDLSPLSNLTNLKRLNLYNNRVKDLSPLSDLTSLEFLELGKNVWITDESLEVLSKLHGLKVRFLLERTVEVP